MDILSTKGTKRNKSCDIIKIVLYFWTNACEQQKVQLNSFFIHSVVPVCHSVSTPSHVLLFISTFHRTSILLTEGLNQRFHTYIHTLTHTHTVTTIKKV